MNKKYIKDLARSMLIWSALLELALTPFTSRPDRWHVFDLTVVIMNGLLYFLFVWLDRHE